MVQTGPLSLVVRANPSNPPYALACLLRHAAKASNFFSLSALAHIHSSLVSQLPNSLEGILKEDNNEDEDKEEGKPSLKFMLIWRGDGENKKKYF